MYLTPRKSLGQHFLTDQNILRNISNAVQARDDEKLLEIGPGEGALTEWLLKSYKNLTAIEVDNRAVELLESKFPGLDVISTDFLKLDFEGILFPDGKNVIVGNIPYNITSPILFRVLDAGTVFRRAVFLMQKEVAERIVAKPGTKTYGILSVQAQLLGKPEYLFSVSRNVFRPKPKVESAVIAYEPVKTDWKVSREQMKAVVRTAFNQRRKKLSNSLKPLLGENKDIGFNLDLRPEQITPEGFLELTEHIFAGE